MRKVSEEGQLKIIEGRKKAGRLSKERWDNNKKEYYENPKRCLNCDNPIVFKNRKRYKFCSSSCSAEYNNRKRGIKKVCPTCGILFVGKKKTFCSFECSVLFVKKKKNKSMAIRRMGWVYT